MTGRAGDGTVGAVHDSVTELLVVDGAVRPVGAPGGGKGVALTAGVDDGERPPEEVAVTVNE